MYFLRIGRRVVNAEYIIMYEGGSAPGSARMVLETGITLDLSPDDADQLRRLTADLIHEAEPEPPRGVVGRSVNPAAGDTGKRRRRKPDH